MEKVWSKRIDKGVAFSNFIVKETNPKFFGVYERAGRGDNYNYIKSIITSGTTLESACKKAKLLQVGYNMAKDSFLMY